MKIHPALLAHALSLAVGPPAPSKPPRKSTDERKAAAQAKRDHRNAKRLAQEKRNG